MSLLDDYLIVNEFPARPAEQMLIAFRGWPDAGDAATATVNYLLTALQAEKFAEIDPEEFFNFTQERPRSTRNKDGKRHLHWPANEFFYFPGQPANPDQTANPGQSGNPGQPGNAAAPSLLIYLGTEPHLRWRTFSSLVSELARRCGVKSAVHIGALLDAVPHTRNTRFSGSSSSRQVQRALEGRSIRSSNYQGPSGITLPISESLINKGISFTTLWGHVAHYLHATPNFRVSLGLARNLSRMLELPADLRPLVTMADAYDREVGQAIAGDEQLCKYIATLEERYDGGGGVAGAGANRSAEMPDAADLVRELEHFLRAEREQGIG